MLIRPRAEINRIRVKRNNVATIARFQMGLPRECRRIKDRDKNMNHIYKYNKLGEIDNALF